MALPSALRPLLLLPLHLQRQTLTWIRCQASTTCGSVHVVRWSPVPAASPSVSSKSSVAVLQVSACIASASPVGTSYISCSFYDFVVCTVCFSALWIYLKPCSNDLSHCVVSSNLRRLYRTKVTSMLPCVANGGAPRNSD